MLVFLDFDGVLNHDEWYSRRDPIPPDHRTWTEALARWCFDPATAARLNRLADAGAKFVVSSMWRQGGLEEMQTILRLLGLRGEVIDITPDLGVESGCACRGQEIKAWIDANAYAGPVVILDDDTNQEPLLEHFVYVDDRFGLVPTIFVLEARFEGVPRRGGCGLAARANDLRPGSPFREPPSFGAGQPRGAVPTIFVLEARFEGLPTNVKSLRKRRSDFMFMHEPSQVADLRPCVQNAVHAKLIAT